jgi:hypothetical protein
MKLIVTFCNFANTPKDLKNEVKIQNFETLGCTSAHLTHTLYSRFIGSSSFLSNGYRMLLPQRKGWAKYEIDYIMHMEWCEEDGSSWCTTKTHVLAANFIFIIIIIIMSIPVASDDAFYNFYHWVSEFFRSDSIPHKTYFRKNVDVSVVTFSVGIPTRWISTCSSQNGGMSKMFPTWNTCHWTKSRNPAILSIGNTTILC